MWNLKRDTNDTGFFFLQNKNRIMYVENKHGYQEGEEGRLGLMYTHYHIYIANKDLMYSTGNSA